MAKVTISTKDGSQQEVTASTPEEELAYDNLPFNDDNVLITRVRPGR